MNCNKCGKDIGDNMVCPDCSKAEMKTISVEADSSKVEQTVTLSGNNDQSDEIDVNKMKEIQTEAYLDALRKLEKEKDDKAKEIKVKKIEHTKKVLKKAFPFAVSAICLALLIVGSCFTIKKVKENIHQYDSIKAAIDTNQSYQNSYYVWKNNRNPSESELKKGQIKLGKYSFSVDNTDAALYFFGMLNSKEKNPKVISVFNKKFEEYKQANEYSSIVACLTLYMKLGGALDTGFANEIINGLSETHNYQAITDAIRVYKINKIDFDYTKIPTIADSCFKEEKIDDFIELLNIMIANNISYDDSFTKDKILICADYYFTKKEYEKALKCYNMYKGDIDVSKKIVECNIANAVQLYRDKNYDSAINTLSKYYGDKNNSIANKLYHWMLIKELENGNDYLDDSYILRAELSLKNKLKNPSSYIKNLAYVYYTASIDTEEDGSSPIIKQIAVVNINYSATNSFGGRVDGHEMKSFSDVKKETKGLSEEELIKINANRYLNDILKYLSIDY